MARGNATTRGVRCTVEPSLAVAESTRADISLWIECFSRMAAVLVTRYPDKGPELWAYQASIVRAARNYEGLAWVAYDRQYRREALARKDLKWSATNSRLYNEAFTGRAKAIPRCRHCLSDSHTTAHCTLDATLGTPTQVHPNAGSSSSEICRSYNAGRCQYVRCRYRHVCQERSYPHPWIQCPKNSSRGGPDQPRMRSPSRKGTGLASVSCICYLASALTCISICTKELYLFACTCLFLTVSSSWLQ